MTYSDSQPTTHTLKHLGQKTEYPLDYNPALLEPVPNPHPTADYWITLHCPEFTSLCPITGQPDFATIYINYIPEKKIIESKSLKLYLFSFRNHGAFHEDCVNTILRDLATVITPKYIEVTGKFTPRGGISIHPYANYGIPNTEYETLARTRLFNRPAIQ
jgi:7-cyano-7-deazaguanine reductase